MGFDGGVLGLEGARCSERKAGFHQNCGSGKAMLGLWKCEPVRCG